MKAILHCDKNWGIGRNNQLMFRLPADMKFFRETTAGKVVVMGLNTLRSFPGGKPLKGRTNIVLCPDGEKSGIAATVDVTELMGSTIHMHVNIAGKDAIVILPTIDLSTEQKTSFGYGSKIHVTFGGNVVHMFNKETEKSLL